MQPRLTTHTLNGRDSVEESVPRTRNIYYEQQTPTNQYKSHYKETVNHPDTHYEDNKYYSFNRSKSSQSKDNWFIRSNSALSQSNDLIDGKYTSDSTNRFQNIKTARPKPLQYENRKYYDLIFPKKTNSNSTDIFYRSNYYLEYADL